MTTALTIIKDALVEINAIDIDETVDGNEGQHALRMLNAMLAEWSIGMTMYVPTTESFSSVVGTSSYTIGSGATIDTTRPSDIFYAWIRLNNIDIPIELIDKHAYDLIPAKAIRGQPMKMYYDHTYANGVIYIYPTPAQAYTIYFTSDKPLSAFSTITDSFVFPQEYALALTKNLAVMLAPSKGKVVSPELAAQAKETKNTLQNYNTRVGRVELNTFGTNRRTNIYTA